MGRDARQGSEIVSAIFKLGPGAFRRRFSPRASRPATQLALAARSWAASSARGYLLSRPVDAERAGGVLSNRAAEPLAVAWFPLIPGERLCGHDGPQPYDRHSLRRPSDACSPPAPSRRTARCRPRTTPGTRGPSFRGDADRRAMERRRPGLPSNCHQPPEQRHPRRYAEFVISTNARGRHRHRAETGVTGHHLQLFRQVPRRGRQPQRHRLTTRARDGKRRISSRRASS